MDGKIRRAPRTLVAVVIVCCATAPEVASRGRREPPPDVAGTTWQVRGAGKAKSRLFDGARWQRAEKDFFDLAFDIRFDSDGTFTMSDDTGRTLAAGVWMQQRAAIRIGIHAAIPPRAGVRVALGGLPVPDGTRGLNIPLWKLVFKLKRARDGAWLLITRYKFRIEARPAGDTYALVAGGARGGGSLVDPAPVDPPALPANGPPTARVLVEPLDRRVVLEDGVGVATLDAGASDDGDRGRQGLTYRWQLIGGAGAVTIASPSGARTEAVFTEAGAHVIELAVSDGQATDTERVVIDVLRAEGSVALAWERPTRNEDGSPLLDLAGFRIYYGICDDRRTCVADALRGELEGARIDVGDATESTVRGLVRSETYFFFVTAYDLAGNESRPSGVAVLTIP